jgi:hypothetical protein
MAGLPMHVVVICERRAEGANGEFRAPHFIEF